MVLSARLIGTLALAIPLAVTGRLNVVQRAIPLVVVAGVCEVLGFYSYTAGARHGIAVAAVLASQFATIAAVVAYFLFKERLNRIQLRGRLECDRRGRPAQRVARVNSGACVAERERDRAVQARLVAEPAHLDPRGQGTSCATVALTGSSSVGLRPMPPPSTISCGSMTAITLAIATPSRRATVSTTACA